MRDDNKKPPRPPHQKPSQVVGTGDIRSTAMGFPKAAHQEKSSEDGWRMVPLSALESQDFPSAPTDSERFQAPKTDPVPYGAPTLEPVNRTKRLQNAEKHIPRNDPTSTFEDARTEISQSKISTEVAKLNVLVGPNAGEERFLNSAVTTIGRAMENTFMTLDLAMSRTHFQIERDNNDGFWVRDLGSANGTFLNAEKLSTHPVLLRPGDRIEAGETLVQFVDEWRPIHGDESPKTAIVTLDQRATAGGSKFGLAWALAVLSLLVAIGALVFALTAGPPSQSSNPAEQAYLEGVNAVKMNDWETAQQKFRAVKTQDPSFKDVDAQLSKIDRELQSSRALDTARALIAREQYDTAIGELGAVPKESVYYAQAKTLLRDAVSEEQKAKAEIEAGVVEDEEPEKVVARSKPSEEDSEDAAEDEVAEEPEPEKKTPKKIKLVKTPAKQDDDDGGGFDLDLGSSKPAKSAPAKTTKVTKKAAPKKTAAKKTTSKKVAPKKATKKKEKDKSLSIW